MKTDAQLSGAESPEINLHRPLDAFTTKGWKRTTGEGSLVNERQKTGQPRAAERN